MQVTARTLNGGRYVLEVQPDDPISNVLQKITQVSGLPGDRMRLLCNGAELMSDKLLSAYRIMGGATIDIVIRSNQSAVLVTASPSVSVVASIPIVIPPKDEHLEKCWSAAYTEDWDNARAFLDEGLVTLDRLEERTGRNLWVFFAERGMLAALQYLFAQCGKPPVRHLLFAVNMSASQLHGSVVAYLLKEVTTIAELESMVGAAQPLHYAMVAQHAPLVRDLLDRGADPNFYAAGTAEGMVTMLGTPLMALMRSCWTSCERAIACISALLDHPRALPNFQEPGTGHTALHVLVLSNYGNDQFATALIRGGADPAILNDAQERASDLVRRSTLSKPKSVSPMQRVFMLVDKGKLRAKKRAVPTDDGSPGPDAKRIKKDTTDPVFHTLDTRTARLDEWSSPLGETEEDDDSGEMRNDEGARPLQDALAQDLLALSQADDALASVAQIALDFAQRLSGRRLISDTDCDWIPFLIEVSKAAKRKASVLINIRQAIRAPKAKLTQKKLSKSAGLGAALQVDEEGDQVASAVPLNEVWEWLRERGVADLVDVRFPDTAICYPVFVAGTVDVDEAKSAIVGVFAVRVDT